MLEHDFAIRHCAQDAPFFGTFLSTIHTEGFKSAILSRVDLDFLKLASQDRDTQLSDWLGRHFESH
jgi:hypothetical protein